LSAPNRIHTAGENPKEPLEIHAGKTARAHGPIKPIPSPWKQSLSICLEHEKMIQEILQKLKFEPAKDEGQGACRM
jgi:hypothetical protein